MKIETNRDTGFLELKQTGLIDRIIEALGLDVGIMRGKSTPAQKAPLVKDANKINDNRDSSYTSVVGMLLYLS